MTLMSSESPHPPRTLTGRVCRGLSLAAAPVLSVMAVLAGSDGGGMPGMACSMPDPSPLGGMAAMYGLMSLFHLTPWLKLLARGRVGARPLRSGSSGSTEQHD